MVEHKPTPDRDDEAFLARFRETWGRPELSQAEAAAFAARLTARRLNGQRPVRLVPALVGAAVVATLVVGVWFGRHERVEDDGFLASLAEAEALAANGLVDNSASGDAVAYADSGDGLWTVLDDETQDGLNEHLSGEYQSLAAWVIPTGEAESVNEKR